MHTLVTQTYPYYNYDVYSFSFLSICIFYVVEIYKLYLIPLSNTGFLHIGTIDILRWLILCRARLSCAL